MHRYIRIDPLELPRLFPLNRVQQILLFLMMQRMEWGTNKVLFGAPEKREIAQALGHASTVNLFPALKELRRAGLISLCDNGRDYLIDTKFAHYGPVKKEVSDEL